jgi:hypothetical protein
MAVPPRNCRRHFRTASTQVIKSGDAPPRAIVATGGHGGRAGGAAASTGWLGAPVEGVVYGAHQLVHGDAAIAVLIERGAECDGEFVEGDADAGD